MYGELVNKGPHLTFKLGQLTTRGNLRLTGESINPLEVELMNVLRWGNKIKIGVAESLFPHPKEWRLGNTNCPLDELTVKVLTAEFTSNLTRPPSCVSKWEKVTSGSGGIDVRTMMTRYKVGLASPKDFGSHYKLIFHRGFLCNPHNPEAPTDRCRACGLMRESITHFGVCSALQPVFEIFRNV